MSFLLLAPPPPLPRQDLGQPSDWFETTRERARPAFLFREVPAHLKRLTALRSQALAQFHQMGVPLGPLDWVGIGTESLVLSLPRFHPACHQMGPGFQLRDPLLTSELVRQQPPFLHFSSQPRFLSLRADLSPGRRYSAPWSGDSLSLATSFFGAPRDATYLKLSPVCCAFSCGSVCGVLWSP